MVLLVVLVMQVTYTYTYPRLSDSRVKGTEFWYIVRLVPWNIYMLLW